ncbi:N-methyltransferase 9 Protein arginine [Collichthys lucidus]|uniref:N-methyltransferase 9 Protein arginine n=1 Tax=Collichthys lucidus TaxID=240159 RepID=A0A4U5U4G9_COLLU|nr:N-methyltransferase 9 Protein arginine [Collichthys lucidus]
MLESGRNAGLVTAKMPWQEDAKAPQRGPCQNELVSSSLESAQQCLFNQDYGTAFVHYLLVLNLAPVFKDFARESFRFTLFKWTEELDSVGRIQDLFDCYEQALELFPADEVILNSMGEHLFRMGFRDEAAGHFHKALKLRPDYPEARENFYRVANWLVERWHFLMLNDHGRNRKYQQAIQKAVQSGCSTVLDIGTGTGILGVSLVVTETVDAGLFGEGIIESLIHAWHHLLLPPRRGENEFQEQSATGRVIPAGATVFGMAVECLEIRRHHRLCVSEVGSLSMAAAGELRSPVSCSSEPDDSMEPYTTERLSRLPGGYKPLTEPFTALDIDFNNVQVNRNGECKRCRFRRSTCPSLRRGSSMPWPCGSSCHLDEESSLSTGPQEDTCWEQAIYPVHSTKGFLLKPQDELIVEVSCRDAYLRLCSVAVLRDGHEIRLDECLDSQNFGNATSNPNAEAELCSALACLQTDQNQTKGFSMLECSEMALLNNHDYHQSFCSALGKLISQLKGFSLLSLIAASHGHVKAYSSVEKNKQQEVLKRLAHSNNIPEQHLEFWLNHVEDEQGMLKRPSREKLWSAIILDCVETCGLIRQKLMEKASLARCLLEEGGRIFPEKIVVHGMLVESDTLLLESAVQGQEPTLGFNIAPFINQFTVPVHVFLDFSTLECKHLSECVELFVLDLMDATANYTDREVKDGTKVKFQQNMTSDLQADGSGEISVSTLNQNSHWKQAAAVLQQPLEVQAGDWVRLAVKLNKSTISISAHIENAPRPMEQ